MQTEKEQEGTDSLHPPEAWQKKELYSCQVPSDGMEPGPGGWHFYTFVREKIGVPCVCKKDASSSPMENKIKKDCSLPGLERSHGGQIK